MTFNQFGHLGGDWGRAATDKPTVDGKVDVRSAFSAQQKQASFKEMYPTRADFLEQNFPATSPAVEYGVEGEVPIENGKVPPEIYLDTPDGEQGSNGVVDETADQGGMLRSTFADMIDDPTSKRSLLAWGALAAIGIGAIYFLRRT